MDCLKFVIIGKVQGVYFRASTVDFVKRSELNINGYVKNLSGGNVEVLAQGEKEDLTILHEWLKHGPSMARVIRVDVSKIDKFDVYDEFKIKY